MPVFSGNTTVYLACGVTDLRKGYTGLAAIIKLNFHLNPYSRCMFAFCNRRRTLIKILQWDGPGFWILMKRLGRTSFHWPDAAGEEVDEIHPSFYKRKKRSGKKEEDLSAFEETDTIEYKPEGTGRHCPDCGTKYKAVSKEAVKRLKFVSARFEAVEEVTYVYSCPKCGAMKRPEKMPPLLKGGIATSSLVSGIMNAKYVNGMPLAHQERGFARYGLSLSAKTMANWMVQCAGRYLQPPYQLMGEGFLQSRYVHGDEARVQAIDEPSQKGTTQNWMWVCLTDGYSGSPRMVLFQYGRIRGGYRLVEFLGEGFHGYSTCDGYQAYHSLPGERYQERQKQAKPLLEAFFEWLHTLEDSLDRSSRIGEAALYTLNQEVYLRRYLEDGHLSIDNTAAERAIKNFAIGRRNWLFSKSIRGAEASTMIYSITETAILNGPKPYNYLTYVLENMKNLAPFPEKEELLKLLPWSPTLPDDCRSKIKK